MVKVLLTTVDGADLTMALATVGRQVYDPTPDVVVVGLESEELPEGVARVGSLEEAIAATEADTDYLWILHSDARPRPDALGALVSEVELASAALGGSKLLVAGAGEELESVGGSTDVFGEPHSGLDEGEIDLQQYDVVREVAFVRSASMLVRRDLAQGLKGLDELLPPIAAGLDFSQRARLAGGRVISVPSSEVYHQGRCNEGGRGWREQAGRLRAMVTAYSPLTLLWLIPYDFIVSVLDSLLSLLLLRWRPAVHYVLSWGWNTYHLFSTIALRRRFKP
ncbi:MAG: glycosyltransferase family 2 protein, partial [Acidobacteria bacterium]|nr:glycosyltransferase family 2 protein [Acidobacteriota bacterium]